LGFSPPTTSSFADETVTPTNNKNTHNTLSQNNRIAISTKLSEASKLLSDELMLQIRLWKHYESEGKEAESRLSDVPDKANKKLTSLKQLIKLSLSRQKQIDDETETINKMFLNSKKLDLSKIDCIISESYRLKTKALHQLEFVKEQINDT
jgi:hypothetical protein